jgi:rhodanese-related sulfurtransferase
MVIIIDKTKELVMVKAIKIIWLVAIFCGVSVLAGKTDEKPRISLKIDQLIEEFSRHVKSVPWITVKQYLALKQKQRYVLIDYRDKKEQAVSMIPGAITYAEFKSNEKKYRKRPLVIYCTIGYRSGLHADNLRKQGFKTFNLRGGVLAWAMNGKNFVTKDGKTTKKVHVYAEKWHVLPKGYIGETKW